MTSKRRHTRGFTLIELILVIVIIGILSAMVVPNFVGVSDDARVAAAQSDITVMGNGLDRYEIYYGTFPSGLEALISGERKFIKGNQIPVDPWDNPYIYRFPGAQNTDSFDLSSNGPPGKNIVINNWE